MSAKINIGLRPKTWEKETKVGCQTVDARRNAVPVQKAWMEVPWRAFEMVWIVS